MLVKFHDNVYHTFCVNLAAVAKIGANKGGLCSENFKRGGYKPFSIYIYIGIL